MKRALVCMLAVGMTLGLCACGGQKEQKKEAGGSETIKVALVTPKVGTNPYFLQMVKGLNEEADKGQVEAVNVECSDTAEYEENIRAFAEEGYDLVVGGSWESGEALNKVSEEYPDTSFALIDSAVDGSNVKCITYRDQEAFYLVGKVAALVTDGESHTYGGVHVNEGAGSWKSRYGFIEGVKSVDPDAKFIFNYTGSYNDPAKAKEYALQIASLNAFFVNAAVAAGNSGVFEAAKEKKFYTSGVDVDQTDKDNPYIVSSCIKDTYVTIQRLIDLYKSGWNTENEEWGVKEGVLGAVWANYESENPVSERLSEDDLAQLSQAASDIKDGKIDLREIPDEEGYKY